MSLSNATSWRIVAPGALLTIGLALGAKSGSNEIRSLFARGDVAPISPVLLGIVLGILWRHYIGLGPLTRQGVQWTLATILRIGIALVGLRLTFQGLTSVGPIAVPVVVACIGTALLVSSVMGRMLRLPAGLQQLLAIGSAVCGCTAIIAMASAIRARPVETGAAVTCVVLLGSAGMLVYPWIAAAIFPGAALPVGVFLGSAIHDTSQVMGASLIYAQQFSSPDVVGIASATKLFRNLAMIILIPLLALVAPARPRSGCEERATTRREPLVPPFVIWFLVLILMRALGDQLVAGDPHALQLWLQALGGTQAISELFMICGMTAVGLSISLSQMYHVGCRPICLAFVVAAATACCSLGLTYALWSR